MIRGIDVARLCAAIGRGSSGGPGHAQILGRSFSRCRTLRGAGCCGGPADREARTGPDPRARTLLDLAFRSGDRWLGAEPERQHGRTQPSGPPRLRQHLPDPPASRGHYPSERRLHHIEKPMRTMADLVRKGRYADGIMEMRSP